MKKGSKEMLRTILSHQELIMKALKIEIPVKPARVQAKKEVKAGKSKVSTAAKPARTAGGKFAPKKAAAKKTTK